MGKVLIIGGTGNIGRELVKMLLEKKREVRLTFRNEEKLNTEGWKTQTENISFSFAETDKYTDILNDIDKLFFVAPPQSSNAYEMITPFLNEVYKSDVKQIVFSSAMGVEFDDSSPLRKLELDIMNSGTAYTFLRPNWFMQNFNSVYLHGIRKYGQIAIPAADSKTSFVDTRDIAELACEAIEYDGHASKEYTVTGSEALDHAEVASILSEVSGKKIIYVPLTEHEFRKNAINAGIPEMAVKYMLFLYKAMRDGYTAPVSNDLPSVLGHSPIKFNEYANDFKEYWL